MDEASGKSMTASYAGQTGEGRRTSPIELLEISTKQLTGSLESLRGLKRLMCGPDQLVQGTAATGERAPTPQGTFGQIEAMAAEIRRCSSEMEQCVARIRTFLPDQADRAG